MATVLSVDDMCRLCLDPFVESYSTIENPAMKDQLEKVFSFPIEFKEGFSSSVCQTCANTVTEFYDYSEKIRKNQEILETTESRFVPSAELLCEGTTIDLISDTDLSDLPEEDEEEILNENDTAQTPPVIQQNDDSTIPLRGAELDEFIDEVLLDKKKDAQDQFISDHFKLTCELCGIVLPTFAHLRHHFLKVHQRQDPYVTCCNKKLPRKKLILEHVRFHLDSNIHGCEHCKVTFTTKKALETHKAIKHGNQPVYKCNRCRRTYISMDLLAAHMKRHNENECAECWKAFRTKQALSDHIERHGRQHECPRCKKSFKTRIGVSKHIREVHDKDMFRFVCEHCGKNFARITLFKRHMDEHEGIEAPKVQCSICERWLKSSSYKTHMDTVHGNRDRVHECDICHRKYPHPVALQNHKSKTHIEAKYRCEYCDKMFIQKDRWEEHLTMHTGAVMFSCEYCGSPYKRRSTVHKHIRKAHPAEWAAKKQRSFKKS
ncbi:zinc finger protein 93-like isoform X7 [Armigeres subalbatus]